MRVSNAASLRADGRRRHDPWPYAGEPYVSPDLGAGECAVKRLDRLRATVPLLLAMAFTAIHAPDHRAAAELLARIHASRRGDLENAIDLGPAIRRQTIRDAGGTVLREPTAEPSRWRDPTDDNPRRRTAREINASRAVDPLHELRRSRYIVDRHGRAARRWLDDFELGQVSLGSTIAGLGVPRAPAAVAVPAETTLRHVARWSAAAAAVGGGLALYAVVHVVLGWPDPEHRDVRAFARQHHLAQGVAMGILIAALDRLADFYDPPDPRGLRS